MNIRNYVSFFASKLWLCISGPSLYGVQLAVYVSFLFEVANILKYPKIYIIQYMNIFFLSFFAPKPQLCISGLGWYGVQLAVYVSFLFEVANIFQPHVVEVVVLVAEAFLSGTAHRSVKIFLSFSKTVTPKIQIKVVQTNSQSRLFFSVSKFLTKVAVM